MKSAYPFDTHDQEALLFLLHHRNRLSMIRLDGLFGRHLLWNAVLYLSTNFVEFR